MEKYKFEFFKTSPEDARHQVHVDWDYLESALEKYSDRRDTGVGPLDFDPEFQRGHVWTRAQQIAYIEYKIRGGICSDVISINCPGFRGYKIPRDSNITRPQIVDGKQRLTAILAFLRGDFPAFGHYRKEFEERLPHYLFVEIKTNHLVYQADVIRWYLALNGTGTPHTEEEIARVRGLLIRHVSP